VAAGERFAWDGGFPVFGIMRVLRLTPQPARAAMLRLAMGAGILLAAAWLFGAIAEDVVNHDAPLGSLDLSVAAWLHMHATPLLTSLMIGASHLGAPFTVVAVAVVAAAVLAWRGERYRALMLVVAVAGGGLMNVLIKLAVHRDRPVFTDPIMTLTSYSFPSGHAVGATVLYGALALIMASLPLERRWRFFAITAALLLIVVICFSRIYLGVHYLSDVVAGFLEGTVWLGVCLFAVDALRRRNLRARSIEL